MQREDKSESLAFPNLDFSTWAWGFLWFFNNWSWKDVQKEKKHALLTKSIKCIVYYVFKAHTLSQPICGFGEDSPS